jgi:hypothetical protein
MTPSPVVRPVLALLASAALTGCALPEGPDRFEQMAEHVAAIPVPMDPGASAERPRVVRAKADGGMRGAFAPVRVEVLEPRELWDNRYGALEAVAAEAAPVVVRAAVRQAEQRAEPALRPAFAASAGRVVQLGAFSSEAAARNAWSRLSRAEGLAGLKPRFETAEVGGRTLVRLRTSVPADAAAAVCRAARINDPWCRQAG